MIDRCNSDLTLISHISRFHCRRRESLNFLRYGNACHRKSFKIWRSLRSLMSAAVRDMADDWLACLVICSRPVRSSTKASATASSFSSEDLPSIPLRAVCACLNDTRACLEWFLDWAANRVAAPFLKNDLDSLICCSSSDEPSSDWWNSMKDFRVSDSTGNLWILLCDTSIR